MIDWITSFFGFRIANKNLLVIFLLGMVLRLVYLDYTSYDVRSYDTEGHLEYISYVFENHKLPNPDQCWECYQNPLYYFLSARLHDMLLPIDDEKFFRILQLLSLAFYAGFVLFGMMIAKEIMVCEKYIYLASSMIVFWPSGIIDSARVGNDDAMYFFYAAGLFFLVKWIRTKKTIFIPMLLMAIILAYLSKSNGLVLVAVSIGAFVVDFIARKKSLRVVYLSSAGIVMTMALVIVLVIRPFSGEIGAITSGTVVKNISNLNNGLIVGNSLGNYLYFDIPDFFKNPFTDSWHDSGGRQFFINYFLKTSMFGEYSFEYPASSQMAIVLGAILIVICLMTLVGILVAADSKDPVFVAMLLNLGFLLLATIFLRAALPFSCSGDFRYAAPIIISLAAFFVFSLRYFSERKFFFVEKAGFAAGYAFVGLSIAFYLDPFIMNLLR